MPDEWRQKFILAGEGVARASDNYMRDSENYHWGTGLWLWNDNQKGQGVEKCFETVLADSRCHRFFSYAARADGNCGCRPNDKFANSIRADGVSDFYEMLKKCPEKWDALCTRRNSLSGQVLREQRDSAYICSC